jgi:hypothetical protein
MTKIDEVLALCDEIRDAQSRVTDATKGLEALREKLSAKLAEAAAPPTKLSSRYVDPLNPQAKASGVVDVTSVMLDAAVIGALPHGPRRGKSMTQLAKDTGVPERRVRGSLGRLRLTGKVNFVERRAKGQRGRGTKFWYRTT